MKIELKKLKEAYLLSASVAALPDIPIKSYWINAINKLNEKQTAPTVDMTHPLNFEPSEHVAILTEATREAEEYCKTIFAITADVLEEKSKKALSVQDMQLYNNR